MQCSERADRALSPQKICSGRVSIGGGAGRASQTANRGGWWLHFFRCFAMLVWMENMIRPQELTTLSPTRSGRRLDGFSSSSDSTASRDHDISLEPARKVTGRASGYCEGGGGIKGPDCQTYGTQGRIQRWGYGGRGPSLSGK